MARRRERSQMPSLEERVAYLEGRMEDHTSAAGDLRSAMGDLREEMGKFGEEISSLRERMNQQFDALGHQLDRHFTWLVGIQVAVLVAIVGTLVGSYCK